MCRFCSGMLTGVVVCLVCATVAIKLIQGGAFSRPAESGAEITEPLPALADPVPLPDESTPVSQEPTPYGGNEDSQLAQPMPLQPPVVAVGEMQPAQGASAVPTLAEAPLSRDTMPAPSVGRSVPIPDIASSEPTPAQAGNSPPDTLPQAPPPPEPIGAQAAPASPPVAIGTTPGIPESPSESIVPQTSPPPTPPAPEPSAPQAAPPSAPPTDPPAQQPDPAPELPAASGDVTLLGTHRCTMEEGHQLKLPDSVRFQIGRVSHLYLAPGPDGCLLICTPAALRQFIARRVEVEETDGLARADRRLFFSGIERCAVDASGSLRVTEEQTRHASLEREVVVIGVDDHLELWDVQRWKEYRERVSAPAAPASTTSPAGTWSGGTPPAVGPYRDPR